MSDPSVPDRERLAPRGRLEALVELADALAYIGRRGLRATDSEDEWGFDHAFARRVYPLLDALYQDWWRVEAVGVGNVPASGRALVVANHAGVLPWDALMMARAVLHEHPSPRHARFLVLNWAFSLPFASVAIRRLGGVPASQDNALRLLEQDHLVSVFPEGTKGIGKPFRRRYQLERFGRGGFVELALRTGAPIIPCAVVGSEEIYPKLGELGSMSRLLGIPYLPITPTFPLLGPLGLVPLPSRWRIEFCEPIDLTPLRAEAMRDRTLVLEASEAIRDLIQAKIYENLVERRGVFR
jgi:1-acyl-sn-glycerol-3-phosphate acyltransferase